mmetsp:Transcript_3273/g.3434  ORF Transcript_3273/g.3434 Transcript_3273/m.3434 type:complete len:149 (+) Transcript_3273:229-675(+)
MANEIRANKRVEKELQKFMQDSVTDGLNIEVIRANCWHVKFAAAKGTIYEGEDYILQVKFTKDYPMDSPAVVFLPPSIPVHPHVYSNGHICLNILGDDWSPALTVRAVCVSILSMLSSNTKRERPPDDAQYNRTNPKDTKFSYHDDAV